MMIVHNLDAVRSSGGVVIFPAYEIGKSQLINFLRGVHDYGLLHKIALITPKETAAVFPVQPRWFIADNSESVPRLIDKLEALKNAHDLHFESVLAVDEEMQFQMSAQIARHFNLPFYDEAVCFAASVKYLSKTVFRAQGVPTGDFALISDVRPETVAAVGFPNVLKPLAGTQSHYIFPNRDMEELQRHFALISSAAQAADKDPRFNLKTAVIGGRRFTLDPKRQFLLEAFIPGDELSCDFMVQGDELDIIRVVKKIPAPLFGMFRGYRLLNRNEIQAEGINLAELNTICRGIASGYGFRRGIAMVDFKINRDGLFVLESSIRPGLSAFNHLMYALCGYTSPVLMAMLNMGAQISATIPDKSGAVVFLYAPGKGFLKEMDLSRLEKRRAEFNIIDVCRFTGDACPVNDSIVDHSDLLQGYVLVKNPPAQGLEELADAISACVEYKMEEIDENELS